MTDNKSTHATDDAIRINPIPFYGSVIAKTSFALLAIFFSESVGALIGSTLAWIAVFVSIVVAFLRDLLQFNLFGFRIQPDLVR